MIFEDSERESSITAISENVWQVWSLFWIEVADGDDWLFSSVEDVGVEQ